MGTGFIRKRFSTIALLDRPHRIDISSHDPLFECFEQKWRFQPAAYGGTNIEYHADFSFRSGLLQRFIGTSFSDRAASMIEAYRQRARLLYGAPKSQRLKHA
jgi:coenzyme Q-binding protein COQ10